MHITVIGAGAVGCYYGGMLARAGHQVMLVGRQQHVDAVNRDGLLLETLTFTERVHVAASTEIDAKSVGSAELILFCVKSDDTEATATQLAPFMQPGTAILSLQNGVDNALRLKTSLDAAHRNVPAAGTGAPADDIVVGPAVVYVAASMAGAGHVKHHGRGELVIGPSLRSEMLADQMHAAGIPVQISEGVISALWSKLVINCAYNALSAITQRPYGVLFAAQGIPKVMRDLVDECLQVAAAMHIPLSDELWNAVANIAQSMPSQFSSTAQDLSRGKRTEIDHLNGYIVRQGVIHSVPTPVNHAMMSMVKLLESQ